MEDNFQSKNIVTYSRRKEIQFASSINAEPLQTHPVKCFSELGHMTFKAAVVELGLDQFLHKKSEMKFTFYLFKVICTTKTTTIFSFRHFLWIKTFVTMLTGW